MAARILIADDDQEILELLKFTFEEDRYTVITASDGEEAVKLAFDEHPDIIILDVNMPRLSGYEVIQKVRENGATCLIPIIMLTSLSKPKDRITGIKLGADEYLSKPFEPFEIVARVEGILRRTSESLAANPVTGLPGNPSIESEIRRRLETTAPFAVIYIDLDNFKAFNDKYGFERGDNIIKLVAYLLRSSVLDAAYTGDFLGHIGGDDFIVVTSPEKIQQFAEKVMSEFDSLIPEQYDEEVRKSGYLWGINRSGQEMKFPLMTVSLGAVIVSPGKFRHYSQVVEKSKQLLEKAKANPKSAIEIE